MRRPGARLKVRTLFASRAGSPELRVCLRSPSSFRRCGEVRDCADLARLGGLSRERISQIMKILWLAPDIQIEVLYFPAVSGSHFPIHELALRNISNRICWNEQRILWSKLKETHHLS